MNRPTVIIAHRACPLHAPENSLEGIRKAAELGADGVEIDVRLTLDGQPVVMHDWALGRTTRLKGPVRIFPWAVLRRVRLKYGDERVPHVADAFDALPDGMFMAIELKDAGAAPGTLALIRERKLEERVLMWSYRERAIRHYAREAPEIEPALLRDDIDPEGLRRMLNDASDYGARGISPHWAAISPQLVGEAHARGMRVFSMNRGLDAVARKASAGLDGIVTDNPREVREILAGENSSLVARR